MMNSIDRNAASRLGGSASLPPVKPRAEIPLLFGVGSTGLFVGLVVILIWLIPLGSEGPADRAEFVRGALLITLSAGAIAFVCRLALGARGVAVFAQALFLRLLILGCFYVVAPSPLLFPDYNISSPTLPVWDDDVHYVGAAEYLNEHPLPIGDLIDEKNEPGFQDKVLRVGFVIAQYKQVLGEAQVWVRLVNVIIGSLTALMVLLALRHVVSGPAARLGALLTVAGPEFIQSSILLYKEGYVHFAAAMLMLGLVQVWVHRSIRRSSLLLMLFGLALVWWVRADVFVLALAVAILNIAVSTHRGFRGAGRTLSAVVLLAVLAIGLLGLGPSESSVLSGESEVALLQGAGFGWASGLTGFARIVHIPISLANPPPFLLHEYLFVQPDSYPWFRTAFRELRTLQWWWMLPWLGLGLTAVWRKTARATTLVVPYLCLFVLAPIVFNGVGPEVVRYRDTFLPCAILLAVLGYDGATRSRRRFAVALTAAAGFGIWLYMNMR
jgi:hypothetical protein